MGSYFGLTKLSARQYDATEDGDEPDYRVWEEVPPAPETSDDLGLFAMLHTPRFDPNEDLREVSLRVMTGAVSAHHVTAVTFTTDNFEVSRHRMEKRELKFAKTASVDLDDLDF